MYIPQKIISNDVIETGECNNMNHIAQEAILMQKNNTSFHINEKNLNKLNGISTIYYSSDKIESDNPEECNNYRKELLIL